MDGFILQIFSGLANGSIYAAVGLALVMIYQLLNIVSIAHKQMNTECRSYSGFP
jgi:branched-chain amino acid transport system permease protein